MIRSGLRVFGSRQAIATGKWATPTIPSRVLILPRGLASSSKDNNKEFVQLRLQEIAEKIQANPRVALAHRDLSKLLETKGLGATLSLENPPSMMELMKLLSDKDIMAGIKKVRDEMKNANIEISPEDVTPLLAILKNKLN